MKSLYNAMSLTRTSSVRFRSSWSLVYNKHGNPNDVINLQETSLPDVGDDEIEIEMLLAAVNPSDINQIQGTYPLKPVLPAVGGNEGVGVVRRCGKNVTSFVEGDWVIPIIAGVGVWRTHLVSKADTFLRLPQTIPLDFAATLQVNPPTAYRMLKDFVSLQPGDCVIQNGANSAVGQSVIQLCAAWGLHSINVIRSREQRSEFDDIVKYLKDLGATEVVSEEFLASHKMKELIKEYTLPSLALNCVGGKSSTGLIRHLKDEGVMITYGGMSRQPVTIPTSAFIFKRVHCVGYWNGLWLIKNKDNRHLIENMFDDLCRIAVEGHLKAPRNTRHELKDYRTALDNALKPFVSRKQLLVINSL